MTSQVRRGALDPGDAYALVAQLPQTMLGGAVAQGGLSHPIPPGALLLVSAQPPTLVVSVPVSTLVSFRIVIDTEFVLELADGDITLTCSVLHHLTVNDRLLLVSRICSATGVPTGLFARLPTRRTFALADQAYLRARNLVLIRQFAPNTTLDPDQLAYDVGADPASADYALTRMSMDGLVRRDPERGHVVIPLDARTCDETFDARCTIELGVLDDALGAVEDEQVELLRACFDRMAAQLVGDRFVDFAHYLDANMDFHHQFVLLGGNNALGALFLSLGVKDVMTRSFGSTKSTSQAFLDVQREMVDAVAGQDLAAARTATIAYRDLAKRRARAILSHTGGWL